MKKLTGLLLTLVLILLTVTGCAPKAVQTQSVTLKVAGAWEDFTALEVISAKFRKAYPECDIEYEYLQDYYASLEKRLAGQEDVIDLFVTTNIQAENTLLPYALDLYSRKDCDLSQCFDGLLKNFEFRGASPAQIYAVPLGAEMRGMLVNVTLLKSLGLEVPKNIGEFENCCRVLKDNGYIPIMGNPGTCAQQLMYPYVCNLIANAPDYDATYAQVAGRQPGLSELFREPMSLLYKFVENGWYDYKYVENEMGMFSDATDEAYARNFLNVRNTDGEWKKADEAGVTAFLPVAMSIQSTVDKAKEDYHSETEYQFILSPMGENGGFAYMSPAHGIGINKNSKNLDWAVKFMSFLFQPENNELFSKSHHVAPNTKEAFSLIAKAFDVPETNVSQLGEVTFDYEFYTAVRVSLTEVAKANNPKYMQEDGTMVPLETFMANLDARLTGEME